jgi:uncharacterized surface protein with fasciclin (FAS1) repeats
MDMKKRLIGVTMLLVMLLSLVGCGQQDSSNAAPAPSGSSAVPSSVPEPEPLEVAYLTGEEKTANYPEGQRIAAVMVGNTPNARPAYGLSEAKILMECEANAGVTRFMAMFEDYKNVPKTGSVRSARDPFIQILIPTYGFYVHAGPAENQPARLMLQQYDYYGNYDLDNVFWRQKDRDNKIFNWYNTDGETITNAVERNGLDDYRSYNSPFFMFAPYNEPDRVLPDGTVNELTVVFTASFRTHFSYSAESGRYAMSQFNAYNGKTEPTIDGNNNEQVAFDNVLVLFAPHSVYPNTGSEALAKVDMTQGGGGFYFCNGQMQRLIWRKGAPDAPLRLYRIDVEEQVEINPGTTYLAFVDDKRSDDFYEQITSGTAQEDLQGEVNTNIVDGG